jgi:hypothetical protein
MKGVVGCQFSVVSEASTENEYVVCKTRAVNDSSLLSVGNLSVQANFLTDCLLRTDN